MSGHPGDASHLGRVTLSTTLPDENGESALRSAFVISGGTGRSSDATGGGTFEGSGNAVTGLASVSYRGYIAH